MPVVDIADGFPRSLMHRLQLIDWKVRWLDYEANHSRSLILSVLSSPSPTSVVVSGRRSSRFRPPLFPPFHAEMAADATIPRHVGLVLNHGTDSFFGLKSPF